MATLLEQNICGICANDFKTNGDLKPVICLGCNQSACRACCKTWILN